MCHGARIVLPQRGIGIDVGLDQNPVRILKIQGLPNAMIGVPRKRHMVSSQMVAKRAQVIQRIAQLERDVIQAHLFVSGRCSMRAHFQQRQIMVVFTTRKERHLAAIARDFFQP